MKMLNIGCGTWSHPDWVNVDLAGGDEVISLNITEGLPFLDDSFDVVYHSHLLEHIPLKKALPFMKDCYRVLKPGGIIRILVPNLEQIAKLYLEKLATAKESEAEYDWIMLELYDQCVRDESGGLMEHYLCDTQVNQLSFISARTGTSALHQGDHSMGDSSIVKFSRKKFVRLLNRLRQEIAGWIVYAIVGVNGRNAFMNGMFRNSGEVHRWMYDSFSLGRLMTNAGFIQLQVISPHESNIPYFAHYKLDVIDGVVRKPDSLVMEGLKP